QLAGDGFRLDDRVDDDLLAASELEYEIPADVGLERPPEGRTGRTRRRHEAGLRNLVRVLGRTERGVAENADGAFRSGLRERAGAVRAEHDLPRQVAIVEVGGAARSAIDQLAGDVARWCALAERQGNVVDVVQLAHVRPVRRNARAR